MIMNDKKIKYLMLIEFVVVICAMISVIMCIVMGVRQYQAWILGEMDVRTLCILKQIKTLEVNQQKQMTEMKQSQQVFLQDWQQTKKRVFATGKAAHITPALEKTKDAASVSDASNIPVARLDKTATQPKPLSPQK